MIRLAAFDLDGTLVGDDLTLSPGVQAAVRAAQARGVTVTLATGRMLHAALPFARQLGLTAPLICGQGALIQPVDGPPLSRTTMEPELVREVLRLAQSRGWHTVLYAEDRVYIDRARYPDAFYRALLAEQFESVADLEAILDERIPDKFVIVAVPGEAERIEDELCRSFCGRAEIVRSHALFVEGNPLGISKGHALERLAAHLRVKQDEVLAVGDQDNDVSMVAWAGTGVAMGNASPAVRAVADWVAPTLTDDGAAAAITRFILDGQEPV